ncbi:flagellar hook-basal body complex protein FliE [Paraferrimonas sp. SM1919]|uniref:flagellar hook-basal body complex protein FliE n=1 Tax=Paraferrimonas sp. SM1919 TaxID=2662263 RepID=UPI0013D5B5D1|nr:flagellar hook-basal body complex protein FliE [Paraferrimonas sp. SM1919]
MQLKENPLLQQMMQQRLEVQPQQSNQVLPSHAPVKGSDFGELLSVAVNTVNGLQKTSADMTTRKELGDDSITLADTVIAREKASVAFEATVEVRNKLVEAYKTIISMPI